MNFVLFVLIFSFICIHLHVWFKRMSKSPAYVSIAHGVHVLFCVDLLIGTAIESISGSTMKIASIVIFIQSIELMYPFIAHLHHKFNLILVSFVAIVIGSLIVLSVFQHDSQVYILVLSSHIIVDILYITRPIRKKDVHIRLFCCLSSLYCLYQIYAILVSQEMQREVYMVFHSGIILALSYSNTESIHRAPRIPIAQRTTTYHPDIASPSSTRTRSGFVTIDMR